MVHRVSGFKPQLKDPTFMILLDRESMKFDKMTRDAVKY